MPRLRVFFRGLYVSVLIVFPPLPTFAVEPAPEALEEVVVSATKTPVPVSQLTSAVEVITGEELEQKKIKMVVDALRLAQGLSVLQSGGPGTLVNVRMRGAQSKDTLVMIDGAIVNSPTDGAFDFANLSAENIERIEILRGAQSMLYGSDAFGGVISIITKRGTGEPTVSSFVEYGSFASLREGTHLSGAQGPFDFAGSFTRWDTSSFSAIDYQRGAAERDGFHNMQGSGRLGVTLPMDGRLNFNLRWWNSRANIDGFAGDNSPADIFGGKQSDRNLILSGSYEQPLTSWWTQKLTLGRTNEQLGADSGSVGRNLTTGGTINADPNCGFPAPLPTCFFPFTSDIHTLNQRIEWQHNFQVAKPLLLTAGYQFREDQGKSDSSFGTQQSNRLISTNAGFAQVQVNVQDRLLLTGGVRQDSYNVFGDATTYRVTGGYLSPETGTKLRGSYATGFRAPTLNDLFFQGANNPDLKPEKSQSYDVGVDQSVLNGKLQISVGYFWNRFRNLIQFPNQPVATCPAATFGFCPQNVALAKSQGWEPSFKYTVLTGLDVRGQYTYTLTRDLMTTQRLPRWPVDQASLGVNYQPIDPLRVNLDYRLVGGRNNDAANTQTMPSFQVVNVSATYNVTKQWQVFGRVDNLFNKNYEEVLFFGTPIRSIYGGVKFTY
jgi:vitamin B12 transporter